MMPHEAAVVQGRLDTLGVASRDTPPFRDPYYWAGFGCWGPE
jgi:CHAT domain-containing protein